MYSQFLILLLVAFSCANSIRGSQNDEVTIDASAATVTLTPSTAAPTQASNSPAQSTVVPTGPTTVVTQAPPANNNSSTVPPSGSTDGSPGTTIETSTKSARPADFVSASLFLFVSTVLLK